MIFKGAIIIKKFFKELIPYAIIIVIVVLLRTFIITPVRVDGSSMKKTLEDGNILLLYKLSKINRYDIVVLDEEEDNEIIIKRIIGMPGDSVEIRKGNIYINDKKIEDDHAYGKTSDYKKTKLASDEYFILGDNRLISKDSRYFGPVKKEKILGKAFFRIFPFNKIGNV